MGFYGDLIGFYGGLMVVSWDFMGLYPLVSSATWPAGESPNSMEVRIYIGKSLIHGFEQAMLDDTGGYGGFRN